MADLNSILTQVLPWLTAFWFVFMTVLSHMPGKTSGAESRMLSNWTHIPEKSLRQGAHIFCFAVLSLLASITFPGNLWWTAAVNIWAFLDELSKIPFPDRHYSGADVIRNLIGVAIGFGVGTLITHLCG